MNLPVGAIRFMLQYDDIGEGGIGRWIDLRFGPFGRGIVSILDLHLPRGMPIETQVLQCGSGMDAIGYELAKEAGLTLKHQGRDSRESPEAML